LIDYKSNMDMSPELAAGAAQFCGSVSLLFDTLSGAFSQMSGMNWTPQQGWAYRSRRATALHGKQYLLSDPGAPP
jgi:roadblock/LC7 domain-containing protein